MASREPAGGSAAPVVVRPARSSGGPSRMGCPSRGLPATPRRRPGLPVPPRTPRGGLSPRRTPWATAAAPRRAGVRDMGHTRTAICLICPTANGSRSRLPLKARPLPYLVGTVPLDLPPRPPARRPTSQANRLNDVGHRGRGGLRVPAPKVPPATTVSTGDHQTQTRVRRAKPRRRTLTGNFRAWTGAGDPLVSRLEPVLVVKPVRRPGA
jgi:hypothetical protein